MKTCWTPERIQIIQIKMVGKTYLMDKDLKLSRKSVIDTGRRAGAFIHRTFLLGSLAACFTVEHAYTL